MKRVCFLLSIILLSCSDDDSPQPLEKKQEREFLLDTVDGVKIVYDEYNRPVQSIFFLSDPPVIHDQAVYNEKGEIVTITEFPGTDDEIVYNYKYENGKVSEINGTRFRYNNIGQLIEMETGSGNNVHISEFHYSDDTSNYISTGKKGSDEPTTTFIYEDVPNVLADYFLLRGSETGFLRSLPSKGFGGPNYTYEYNERNLPSKITITINGNITEEYNITYQ